MKYISAIHRNLMVIPALLATFTIVTMPPISSAATLPATSTSVTAQSSVSPTTYNCYNTKQYVQLSFDDSATETQLKSILATLKKNNAKATFFFNTSTTSAAKFRMIRRAGQQIGNHTKHHVNLPSVSSKTVRQELDGGRTGLTNTRMVRPPYGATNKRVRRIITDRDEKQCLWTVDTMDWSQQATHSSADIINRVRYGDKWTPRVEAGGMILMHGSGRYTAAALPGVILAIKARGLSPQPLH